MCTFVLKHWVNNDQFSVFISTQRDNLCWTQRQTILLQDYFVSNSLNRAFSQHHQALLHSVFIAFEENIFKNISTAVWHASFYETFFCHFELFLIFNFEAIANRAYNKLLQEAAVDLKRNSKHVPNPSFILYFPNSNILKFKTSKRFSEHFASQSHTLTSKIPNHNLSHRNETIKKCFSMLLR